MDGSLVALSDTGKTKYMNALSQVLRLRRCDDDADDADSEAEVETDTT
jgi:hypothetical protein